MKTHTSSLTILERKKLNKIIFGDFEARKCFRKNKKTTYQHTATCQIYSFGPLIEKKIFLISLTAAARIQFHFPTRNITVFTGITLLSHTSKV